MSIPEDPGAAAVEAARNAGERAVSAGERRRSLPAPSPADGRATGSGEDDRADRMAQARTALEEAQRREVVARTRVRTGLLRAAQAHDRAADRHDQAARQGGTAASEHRQRAAVHRADADADRRRADDITSAEP